MTSMPSVFMQSYLSDVLIAQIQSSTSDWASPHIIQLSEESFTLKQLGKPIEAESRT